MTTGINLWKIAAIAVIAEIADAVTTTIILQNGGVEYNTLFAATATNLGMMLVVKMLFCIMVCLVAYEGMKLQPGYRFGLGYILAVFVAIFCVWPAVHNIGVLILSAF